MAAVIIYRCFFHEICLGKLSYLKPKAISPHEESAIWSIFSGPCCPFHFCMSTEIKVTGLLPEKDTSPKFNRWRN
ncbi:MAG: hypothetical protein R8G66_03965 [Cytophagales bacterium]|nr:hypothetical protein [Cytophagales bacterium]